MTESDEPLARDLPAEKSATPHLHGGEACAIAELTRPVSSGRAPQNATAPRLLALDRDDALVFLIDTQERLAAAMEPAELASVVKNISVLLRAAATLGMPVIASEHYPKGLGRTLPALASLLPSPPMEKIEFSAGNNPALARAILETRRRQVILIGMEAHVCIFQTARDLVGGGLEAYVVADATMSRTVQNRNIGLQLCEKAGAICTGTETVLFDLLGRGGTPEFRALSALIK